MKLKSSCKKQKRLTYLKVNLFVVVSAEALY